MTAGGTVYPNQPSLMLGDWGDGSVSGGDMLELVYQERLPPFRQLQFILWPKISS